MDAGDFVPDSVTNEMVRDRLRESDVENGFLRDGYPRTMPQVDYLDEILAKSEEKLDVPPGNGRCLELNVNGRSSLLGGC